MANEQEREIEREQRLTRMEAKLDIVVQCLGPGGSVTKRIENNENEIKNMKSGAIATLFMMLLGVISFVAVYVWNKVTGKE